ncbi:uncharacterized protein LOC142984969 [Anticarsia gemmatalis]|uniref:uncharacterized protein LOC142984969 n=1 Tax=Anticarsia gemmatalis TaxID=129554 RepID=UPI003F75FA6A
MERWCDLVAEYPDDPGPKHLAKALATASSLLTTDLAPFEIDWLTQTLFFKPINVFTIIQAKRADESWMKNIGDAFKLMSKIVIKHWAQMDKYSADIVELCVLPFDALTKKESILCLINVLKNPGVDAGDVRGHINALEGASTCKAPLALLVGTICRYYPECVQNEYIRIWRIYLKMLQPANRTDTIVNAVLQGIDGLLVNFGTNIPMMELNHFYDDFSRKCAKISKCIDPLLSILHHHAALFKERLAGDKVLRLFLWETNSVNVKNALIAVYDVLFEDLPEHKIKEILRSEVYHRIGTDSYLQRHTAMRILIKVQPRLNMFDACRPDKVEFQLRKRALSYQDADLVSLFLESRESFVKPLLAATILFYNNIPAALRLNIVVKSVLKAPQDVRKMAIQLLVDLSVEDLEVFSDLWRGLLSDDEGLKAFEDTLDHIAGQLNHYLQEKDTEKLLSLSSVLSFVLCASETGDRAHLIDVFKPIVVEITNTLCLKPSEVLSSNYICAEMFDKNNNLNALVSTFEDKNNNDLLLSLMTIFTKDNAEPNLLIKAVSEMEQLLKENNDLDFLVVQTILKQILKLKSNLIITNSTDRVLERNISLFLCEYENLLIKEQFSQDLYSKELKNKLFIIIPNTVEAKNYKIDLLRILQLSITNEDFETLHCLITIITVILRDRPDPGLQTLAWKTIHAMMRSSGSVDVTPVLKMCSTMKTVQLAIDSITQEPRQEVRQLLCECLQVVLLQSPGSEAAAELLDMLGEQLLNMMDRTQYHNAGIDITRIFITTLQQNNNLSIKYLPKIIIKFTRISIEVFKIATELYIEKIDIFNNTDKMAAEITENMFFIDNKMHLECVITFLKNIFSLKNFTNDFFVENVFEILERVSVGSNTGVLANALQILALSKQIFDFDENLNKTIVMKDFNDKIKQLDVHDVKILQSLLLFYNIFSTELIKFRKEKI